MGNHLASVCHRSDPDYNRKSSLWDLRNATSSVASDGYCTVLSIAQYTLVAVVSITMEHVLQSQGMIVAKDGTAAYAHCSSVCAEYYMSQYESRTAINMDRNHHTHGNRSIE